MKQFLATLILIPSFAFACDMERISSETQFVIDPASGKLKQESKNNNAKFELSKCEADEKYLLVNFNSIYFQDDTARLESVSGQLVQKSSNCSIQSEIPYQKVETSFLEQLVQQRHSFLQACTRLVIADQRGQKIQLHPKSACQLKNLNDAGSAVEATGEGCLIAVNPNTALAIEAKLNPDCLQSSFLEQNQIQAQDVEGVIKIWPVAAEKGQLTPGNPLGARYVRYTILPSEGFMPRAVKDDTDQAPFISVLSTNIDAGNIAITTLGKNRISLQPTFLVQNISKEFCQGGHCARPSSYVAPIAGMLSLSRMVNGRKVQVGDWSHALKIPSNWSGLAEFKNENNLTGLSMGALTANMSLNAGDEFMMEAKFYEPRATLDDLSYTQSFFDMNNDLSLDATGEEALPSLPKVGNLGRLDKLPSLPAVALGRAGVLEFSDRFNMTHNWTQKYDRVCNAQNLNCQKLVGKDKPFVILKMRFKIGPNKEIVAEHVTKQSSVFGGYDQDIKAFAKKVCE